MDRLDLERFLPFRLNRLATEISRALGRLYGERFGIDIPEWRVIATLGHHQAARAQDIVRSTRMHKSMVSRAVARLEQRGWVERGQSEADRREAPLRLSAAGRAVYRELVPFVLGYERAILASLSIGEQQQMAALLTKLEASLALSNRSAALGEEA